MILHLHTPHALDTFHTRGDDPVLVSQRRSAGCSGVLRLTIFSSVQMTKKTKIYPVPLFLPSGYGIPSLLHQAFRRVNI